MAAAGRTVSRAAGRQRAAAHSWIWKVPSPFLSYLAIMAPRASCPNSGAGAVTSTSAVIGDDVGVMPAHTAEI